MPVVALKPLHKIGVGFGNLTPSGKVKIYLEASEPVDVFFSKHGLFGQISSTELAQKFESVAFPGQMKMNYIEVPIPPAWTDGFDLIIGNPHTTEIAAVFYGIFPA
jgi:hypothetical protein